MANKRISLTDRLHNDRRGVDALFGNTPAETNSEVDTSLGARGETPSPKYVRRTFHIRPEHVKAIRRFAYEEELDISEVVRRALDAFLPRY